MAEPVKNRQLNKQKYICRKNSSTTNPTSKIIQKTWEVQIPALRKPQKKTYFGCTTWLWLVADVPRTHGEVSSIRSRKQPKKKLPKSTWDQWRWTNMYFHNSAYNLAKNPTVDVFFQIAKMNEQLFSALLMDFWVGYSVGLSITHCPVVGFCGAWVIWKKLFRTK